jgi:hypothetical protein
MTVLRKVLLATYGRSGKRRVELLQPLLVPIERQQLFSDGIANLVMQKRDTAEVTTKAGDGISLLPNSTDRQAKAKPDKAKLPKPPPPPPPSDRSKSLHPLNRDISEALLTPQLSALVKSQLQHGILRPGQSSLTQARPQILALATSGLPMPISRLRNLSQDWYRDVLLRVLPPLPTAEWNRLRNLANTTQRPHEILIPRRRSAAGKGRSSSSLSRPSMLELVVSGAQFSRGHFENREARNLTPRMMQRAWAEVFKLCPLLRWDEEWKTWTVTWGEAALKLPRPADEVKGPASS